MDDEAPVVEVLPRKRGRPRGSRNVHTILRARAEEAKAEAEAAAAAAAGAASVPIPAVVYARKKRVLSVAKFLDDVAGDAAEAAETTAGDAAEASDELPVLPSSLERARGTPGSVHPQDAKYSTAVAYCHDQLYQLTQYRGEQYHIIVADPPWPYGSGYYGTPGYNAMSETELSAMGDMVRRLAVPKCSALLLWTTGPMMRSALRLMETWGFLYKTVFLVWRKMTRNGYEVFPGGKYTRASCEFLLIGLTRGSRVRDLRSGLYVGQTLLNDNEGGTTSEATAAAANEAPESCEAFLETVRQGHSIKPDEAFERMNAFFRNDLTRIELFARRPRSGWDTWGLELKGYFNGGCEMLAHLPRPTAARQLHRESEQQRVSYETLRDTLAENPDDEVGVVPCTPDAQAHGADIVVERAALVDQDELGNTNSHGDE